MDLVAELVALASLTSQRAEGLEYAGWMHSAVMMWQEHDENKRELACL